MTSDKKIEMSLGNLNNLFIMLFICLDDIIKEDRKRGDGKRGKKRGAIRKVIIIIYANLINFLFLAKVWPKERKAKQRRRTKESNGCY